MNHDELVEVRKIVEWANKQAEMEVQAHRTFECTPDTCSELADHLALLDETKRALEVIDQALLEE